MGGKWLFPHSIRGRTFLSILLTTLIFGLTSFYSAYSAQVFLNSLTRVFQRNQSYLDLTVDLQTVSRSLETYLLTKSTEDLLLFWKSHQRLSDRATTLDRSLHDTPVDITKKNIATFTDEFLIQSIKAVEAKRGRDVPGYQKALAQANKISRYILTGVETLNSQDFRKSLLQGRQVFELLGSLQMINMALLFCLTFLGLLLAYWFSYMVSKPLQLLTVTAEQIAKGNFQTPLPRESKDETGILTQAFAQMREAILKNLQELKEKAEIENGLMAERLKNLQMKNLLKNAELQALQAQINPHFLFNTLNAGAQLALMEEADQTSQFLENMSELFRQNLRPLDRSVYLHEEIRYLEHYLYLQKIRFGDRFEVQWVIQENYPDIQVPPLILQPLVENSLAHGLRHCESGGWIKIEILTLDRHLLLAVEDNGEGISKEVIKQLLSTDRNDRVSAPSSEKSMGIGLGNVIDRLRLFFNRKNIVEIKSKIDQGTRIQLILPLGKEQDHD